MVAEDSEQGGVVVPWLLVVVFAVPSSMPSPLNKVGVDSSGRSEPDFTLDIFLGYGQ